MPANLENSAVATGLKNVIFHSNLKERQCQESSRDCTIALISHGSKFMLKCFKLVFNRIQTENFQIYKLDLEKAEEPEIKLPTSVWIIVETRKFQENIYFCFIDYAKAFDCVDHNKLGNS